jgi:hypothetical protein
MHYYGFQVDLAERPDAILRATSNGAYNVDYTVSIPPYSVSSISMIAQRCRLPCGKQLAAALALG